MYAFKAVVFLFASASASIMLAEPAVVGQSVGSLEMRDLTPGWSLQSSSCPFDTAACGSGGSCCPSNLKCNPAANDEVAACCPDGDCRGAIEGAPICADPSWDLWKGLNGNGFCCLSGQVGIYDSKSNVAGTCVFSAPSGAQTAVLMSTGSVAGPTSSPSSFSNGLQSDAVTPTSIASASSTFGASSSSVSSSNTAASSTSLPTAVANANISSGSLNTSTTSAGTAKATNSGGKMGVSVGLLGVAAVVAFVL